MGRAGRGLAPADGAVLEGPRAPAEHQRARPGGRARAAGGGAAGGRRKEQAL